MTVLELSDQLPVSRANELDIRNALAKRYGPLGREWALFDELALNTGVEQRVDVFAINLYSSQDYLRIAWEIKVSRSDFLREIKHKSKRRRALLFSNRFYFITPVGLLRAAEIPVECGLQEVDAAGEIHTIVPAPDRDSLPPTWGFFAALARRAVTADDHQRTVSFTGNVTSEASMA